jgi:hypothetical protein
VSELSALAGSERYEACDDVEGGTALAVTDEGNSRPSSPTQRKRLLGEGGLKAFPTVTVSALALTED